MDHTQLLRLLGGPYAVAKRLRIKPPSVYKWVDAQGRVRIPDYRLIELGMDIERVTKGTVTRRDLRPDDAHLIWPDLAVPAVSEPNPVPAPADQAQAAINKEAIEEGAA